MKKLFPEKFNKLLKVIPIWGLQLPSDVNTNDGV